MNPTAYDMFYGSVAKLHDRDRELAAKRAQSRASQPKRRDNLKGKRR